MTAACSKSVNHQDKICPPHPTVPCISVAKWMTQHVFSFFFFLFLVTENGYKSLAVKVAELSVPRRMKAFFFFYNLLHAALVVTSNTALVEAGLASHTRRLHKIF